ncbi:fasciclin domain-containing protein [Pseudaestuariivita rosea]|uniref:fasciclin domain-containing protein n=1 Tax=Pseudaestuariivita rosea TaxID=2763263 RepID=UPI001ABBAA67|nr:fasciclin domain-containing protein [Pseudaestuariivita rosea]
MKRRTTLKSIAAVAALTIVTACAPASRDSNDIVDIAAGDDRFSTLVAAVQAADLVDTLKSDGPFTVFAPTNEAFAALPPGTLESLLEPENKDQLVAILTYHVAPGVASSSDLAGRRTRVLTANGQFVPIDGRHGVVVDGANVIIPDIIASNGIIHAIDQVILPD